MDEKLIKLIQLAGIALEREDRFLLRAIAKNQEGYRGAKGGILRFKNERYYQFIIRRELILSYSYPADIEIDTYDLVIKDPNNDKQCLVIAEMKKWMSETGKSEIDGIRKDIEKLSTAEADHRLMIIFSANPDDDNTKGNIEYLERELRADSKVVKALEISEPYVFQTINPDNGKNEKFWILGIEVRNC